MATINVTTPPGGDGSDIRGYIQTAVGLANDGDTIVIPAGSYTMSGTVTVTEFVSFRGAGISATTLYRSESMSDGTLQLANMFYFNINSRQSSKIVFSDMWLKSKIPQTDAFPAGSTAEDVGINFNKCVDFVVTRCRLEYFGNGAISITHHDDIARGLIYNNQFYWNAKGEDGQGLGYGVVVYGENLQWIPNARFGSSNFIFIENNTFEWHRHSIAAGGCALYVARYNTVTNNLINDSKSVHAIDAHSPRGGSLGSSNYFGTRAIEVYNNTFLNTLNFDRTTVANGQNADKCGEIAIQVKGGEGLVYNNLINGYRFGCGIYTDSGGSYLPWGNAYPYPYINGCTSGERFGPSHSGTDSRKGNGDLFVWNNTFNTMFTFVGGGATAFYVYTQPVISGFTQGRDYHLVPKPFYQAFTYPHPLTKKYG